MKEEYLEFLCCPKCKNDLEITENVEEKGKIKTGKINCSNESCNSSWPIRNFVPRFVNNGQYANSFGEQWKTFAKTQLDNQRSKESELRWNSEINWDSTDLQGKKVVEFGSGAGRFVDIVSRRNAGLAMGVDITDAVDASQENLGHRDNVFFIQADFFNLPIKEKSFDFAYSIGVLHHTPDPEGAFAEMIKVASDSASIGLCLYEISLYHRPNRNTLGVATRDLLWALNLWRCEFFRVFTTRIPDPIFLAYCKYFIPILHYINKVPVIRYIRYLFPSTCYPTLGVEWSMVDTNDTYATKIVHQYRHKDVFQWFMKQNLQDIIIHNSVAGWVSITANKQRLASIDYAKYIHTQPITPGN